MCGIVGAASQRMIAHLLIDGLKKLEYRGYDSAGIALINESGALNCIRVVGKVRELENALTQHPSKGHMGIAHTRWATHGVPSEKNAHPVISHDDFALVHNGIIENHSHLRENLSQAGYQFHSDTDTEVIVHLIHHHHLKTRDFLNAVRETVRELEGAYSLGVISKQYPNRLIAVRHGSPLVIGCGVGEYFIASDPLALLSSTKQFIYLEEDDIAEIAYDQFQIYDKNHHRIQRKKHILSLQTDSIERGDYRHYMQKEIMEQPTAIQACLLDRLAKDHVLPGIFGPLEKDIFKQVEHIQLVACGTSYHACMVAAYWIESLIQLPCSVEIASEFRYRDKVVPHHSLFVVLSQSGETADTLAALRLAAHLNYLATLAICNVSASSITLEADIHFLTRAGIEIGVASTKAFTTQLISLLLLILSIAREKNKNLDEKSLIEAINDLPRLMQEVINQETLIANWAQSFIQKQHAIFVARGLLFPIALEGALKMKEISYIHSEGYPAGELKHGPLALIDGDMPVIATVPHDKLFEKHISNLEEINARGGKLFILTDNPHLRERSAFKESRMITMPSVHALLSPLLYTVPLQLLAYYVAILKGTDVDQPRNLAKSVTVE